MINDRPSGRYISHDLFRLLWSSAYLLLIAAGCSQKETHWQIPESVEAPASREQFLEFAWDQFIALNWPASSTPGKPDTAARLGDQGNVVWETWKEPYDVFLDGARTPPAWEVPDLLPDECKGSIEPKEDGHRVIRMSSKVSGHAQENILDERLQAVGGVLLDRQGKLARYEVRMNRLMFKYIRENTLYNAVVQSSFPIEWPQGSMELKASWRELTEKEVDNLEETRRRYHVSEAVLLDPPGERFNFPQKDGSPCQIKQMALVGLHVVHKIPGHDPFIWATFEHEDNITEASFNDPDCPDDCVVPPNPNQPIDTRCRDCVPECWNTFQYCPDQTKTQVTRQVPIPGDVEAFNTRIHGRGPVRGTKWAHYNLVGVQYPSEIDLPFDPESVGETFLGNTTMETFNQTASSCVGCHSFARASNPFNLADFSWFVRRAKFPPDTVHEFPPGKVQPGRELPKLKPSPEEVLEIVYGKRPNAFTGSAEKPYEEWGTWPKDAWNNFEISLRQPDGSKGPGVTGENPHGNFVRIFVNDLGLKAVRENSGVFPPGTIVLKENLPFRFVPDPSDFPTPKQPLEVWQPAVELTVMYKQAQGYFPQGGDWYYLKSAPLQPGKPPNVDRAGRSTGCASCHGWQGNADFMLTFNFGKPPVIRTRCVDDSGNDKDCKEGAFDGNR